MGRPLINYKTKKLPMAKAKKAKSDKQIQLELEKKKKQWHLMSADGQDQGLFDQGNRILILK